MKMAREIYWYSSISSVIYFQFKLSVIAIFGNTCMMYVGICEHQGSDMIMFSSDIKNHLLA